MRPVAWILRFVAILVAGALLVTSVVVAVAPRLWGVANSHQEAAVPLPEFEPLSGRSFAYDRDGNLIDIYELENSQPVELTDIPERVISAFLAVEDKEFFEHDGVNLRSLVRATLSNFASDAPQQGASTITMQVVKNEFLAGLDRDGRYKLLQIHYARMLENELSKPEILERYLNTVFFGNNAYGVQAASETYFAKNVDELTFIEAAFLAGLVRAPTTYDPINNPERSRNRFVQVLERLVEDGKATRKEARLLSRGFVLPERVRSLPTEQVTPSYYSEALREYLLRRSTILGDTFEERYNKLYRGGLRIHTTLDPTMQLQAAAARNKVPPNATGIDAAVVSLDTQTSAIRAMIGGSGFTPENQVNMALAPRQTGSSIKIFVLAAALQAGALPDDIVDGFTDCNFPIVDQPGQFFEITEDAVTGGLYTVEENTARSINCAYARLSMIVGLNRVVDMTYRMADSPYLFQGQTPDDRAQIQPFTAYVTGSNEMSTLDMASGAQTIANEGVHHRPYYVVRIENERGQEIYQHFDAGTQVLDRNVALNAIKVLKTVFGQVPPGTGRNFPLANARPAAGKTGTQEANTNATFVGFTPQLTTAVWMGDPDKYTSMDTTNVPEFTEDVQGGRLPTEIWKTFMDAALAGRPALDWPAPPPPSRFHARLFLPGKECVNRVVRYETRVVSNGFAGSGFGSGPAGRGFGGGVETPGTEPPRTNGPPPTQPPPPPTEPPATEPPATEPPATEPPATQPPATRPPVITTATTRPGAITTAATAPPPPPLPPPQQTSPRTTDPPAPVTQLVPVYDDLVATTIRPDVLNPNAPIPSVPVNQAVFSC